MSDLSVQARSHWLLTLVVILLFASLLIARRRIWHHMERIADNVNGR